ncbi:MAG: hypothetical protein FJ216_08530 [Ignavibacteria bacterium]|nr:hypothetical protein [Ignavibacteria bacterium]
MKIKILLIICLSFVFTNTLLFSQINFPDSLNVLILQDSRTIGENKIPVKYLKSEDKNLVIKSLTALANVQDSSTIKDIAELLMDNDANIRFTSAFSLGHFPNSSAVKHLLNASDKEKETQVKCRIIESLGLTGDEEILNIISKIETDDKTIKKVAALSIARFANRNIKNLNGIISLKNMMSEDFDEETGKYISYAFFRIRDKVLLKEAHKEILSLCNSKNEFSKMWAFVSLGIIGDKNDFSFVTNTLRKEDSWIVKINILNSLNSYIKTDSRLIDENLTELLLSLFDDDNPHVRITAIKTAGILFKDFKLNTELLQKTEDRLNEYFITEKAIDWREKGEAINSYAVIFKDRSKQILTDKYIETPNYGIKAYIIRAFRNFEDAGIYEKVRELITEDINSYNKKHNITSTDKIIHSGELAILYRAFIDLLSDLMKRVSEEERNLFKYMFLEFTGSKDLYLIENSFISLSDSIFLNDREEISKVLSFDYKELSYPEDKDAIILFINQFGEFKSSEMVPILEENLKSDDYELCKYSAEALEKITGKKYKYDTKPKYFFNTESFEQMISYKYAVLHTEKGDIKIMLLPEIAPFSVRSFIDLAEKNYYDSTIFHRVIPNFVIQGGDPTETGSGGPDYSLRTEIAPVYFERGMFGLASSGKDTEGSQFFITHSPQYHLDGRYTILGKVIEGMDAVDKIVIYDKLYDITLTNN